MKGEADFCTLHRNGGSPWKFKWSSTRGAFRHITQYGLTYVIVKPFRKHGFSIAIVRKTGWTMNQQKKLKARYIEFADGGRYVFTK